MSTRWRGAEIAYVRTSGGYEVDFLARCIGGKQELIQVCANLEDPSTRRRELRSLIEAGAEYPDASQHLVTITPGRLDDVPDDVAVHDAAEWLLR